MSKAPVTEAVLDFRTRLPAEVEVGALREAVSKLAEAYPTVEDAWLIEGSLAISSEPASTVSSSTKRANGFFIRSRDGRLVAQFRLDGFTFSRLAPYTSWEEIAPEAFRLWDIYKQAAKPTALYRSAVRYINHIRLPETPIEMNTILVSAPQVPTELPQVFSSFLTRVIVPLPMPNTHVSIVQAYNAPPAATTDTFLLDVDVFRDDELELDGAKLRPVFEELRVFKNKAFFGSLTEAMVEMIA